MKENESQRRSAVSAKVTRSVRKHLLRARKRQPNSNEESEKQSAADQAQEEVVRWLNLISWGRQCEAEAGCYWPLSGSVRSLKRGRNDAPLGRCPDPSMQIKGRAKKFQSAIDLRGTGYCVCFNSRKTARAVTQLYDAALQPSGIRTTQLALLVGVAKTEPVSIGRLGEVLIIDRTTLTRSLRLMQREKLLSISPRSVMRQRFVMLSPKGWRALKRSLPHWRKIQEAFLDTIGEDFWISMQREMERMAHAALDLQGARTC